MITYPDPVELWKVTKARLDAMTDAERRQTLVDAGILTPDFKPAKPYRRMFAEGARQAREAEKHAAVMEKP
jgi:hypothetical protein